MPRRTFRRIAIVVAGLLGVGGLVVAPQATAASPSCSVLTAMESAADYWVANGTDMASNDWQNATFHVGNLAMVRASGMSNHKTLPWAEANGYQLQDQPNGPFFPDYFAAGEAYLALQYFHPDRTTLAALESRVDAVVANVQKGQTTYWNYVDALNMAMPSFAQLGVLDGSQADLDAMHTLFEYTKSGVGGRGLLDPRTGLWWRDASDIGTRTFWSRGNGWAFAAMAKVLAALPPTDPHRAEYQQVYLRMAGTLARLQRPDGFWNVDLLDPFDHGGPETSGTALFTYGLAWGVDNGLLPADRYVPVVRRAWDAMTTTALRPSGLLGYVQGPARGPSDAQPVTADDTSAYGVGAFLLAGQQVAALTPDCLPAASVQGWHLVRQATVSDTIAGEGIATVRAPGRPVRIDYTDGATIPAAIKDQGWGHVGDPDSWHGYVIEPYQQVVTAPTEKMIMVTTPTGRHYEYTHRMTGDEQAVNANAYAAVSPDGRWLVSSELAPVNRLLVFPTPLLNPATPRTGGTVDVASRIVLDHTVRNLQGCDFVTAATLICASDDPNSDIYPTSKPLLRIDLAQPLHGRDVAARVTSLGQVPRDSTCTGTYTVEGVDYDATTGDLRVEVVAPSPCDADVTVYTLHR